MNNNSKKGTHGGHREGSGRKVKSPLGKSELLRLPEKIAQIAKYLHSWFEKHWESIEAINQDSDGFIVVVYKKEVKPLLKSELKPSPQLVNKLTKVKLVVKDYKSRSKDTRNWVEANRLLKELIEILKIPEPEKITSKN